MARWCSQMDFFWSRPSPCSARSKFLVPKSAFSEQLSKAHNFQTKCSRRVKIGMQAGFGPKNLHAEGFLLHTIFYLIKLICPPILLNRSKVVLPPRADEKFWRVLNAYTIGDHILKNLGSPLSFWRKNWKTVFLDWTGVHWKYGFSIFSPNAQRWAQIF